MTGDFSFVIHRLRTCGFWLVMMMAWLDAAGRVDASETATLAWNSSLSPNIAGYRVYYGTQSRQYTDSVTVGNVSSAVIPGLADGERYYFAVSAIDNNGHESGLSNEAQYPTPAPPPIGLQAQATTVAMQAVDLVWPPSPNGGVVGYVVNYGLQSGLYTNSATFYFTTEGIISGLAAGVTYYFSVSPIDAYGSEGGASSEVSYTVPVPAPIVLQAQMAAGSSGVELTWNALPGEGVVGYNIYYGNQSGTYNSSINCGNVTDYVVHGLPPGQTYYFVVAAVDGYGNQGKPSNEASSSAAAPVPVAIQVQGTTVALEAVNVSWTPSTDPDVYGYAVNYWIAGADYTNSLEFDDTTTGIISGLAGGATYNFTISPVGSFGVEAVASGQAVYAVPNPQPIVLYAQKPTGSTGVELTWNALPDEGITSYNIYYGTQSGAYSSSVNCGNVNDFILRGLTPGQAYYFAVTAEDDYGNQSGYSSEASSQVAGPVPVVVQVQGTTVALEAVDVSWTPSTDQDVYGYAVNYWIAGADYTNSMQFDYTTDGIISGLVGGATYNFTISPVGSAGVEAVASGEVAYAVPVPQPIVLTATVLANSGGVALSWNAVPNEGIVGYNIYYGTTSSNYSYSVGDIDATNYDLQGLPGGQANYFAVTAVDGYGNQTAYSSEASAVTPLPSPMVLELQVYNDDNGQPEYIEITTSSKVYGSWEIDYSTDFQNWYFYQSGSGSGNVDGYDVDAYAYIDPMQPQVFYRAISY